MKLVMVCLNCTYALGKQRYTFPMLFCYAAAIIISSSFMAVSPHSSVVFMVQVEWLKNILGRSIVQNSTEHDTKRCWRAMVEALKRHIIGMSGKALPVMPEVTALTATAAPVDEVIARQTVFGQLPNPAVLVLLASCLVFLTLLILCVWRVGTVLSHELHELTGAIRESTVAAGCPVRRQVLGVQGATGVEYVADGFKVAGQHVGL